MFICATSASAQSYQIEHLELERHWEFQDIKSERPKSNTTELLVVSASHGNPQDNRRRREVITRSGDWVKVAYAGNDDKSIHVWYRYICDKLTPYGKVNIKNGSADMALLVFQGRVTLKSVKEKTMLKTQKFRIRNNGLGPYLILAASDNPQKSEIAYQWGSKRDDQNFLYWTDNRHFADGIRIRGAAVSIGMDL